jgi:beta-barrel assembly-enhancing protease
MVAETCQSIPATKIIDNRAMNRRRSFIRQLVLVLLSLVVTLGISVGSSQLTTAVPVDQLIFRGIRLFQLSNLSTQQKVALGRDIHQQVVRNQRVGTNTRVSRIGQRLAAASECSQQPFRFYVVQDRSINAFTTTGGYVYVNTGLLQAADNDAQLASVLAHEIAHNCNNDFINKLRQSQLAQIAATATGLDRSTLANIGYRVAIDLPNSRQAEFAADADGVKYMRQAGYNPQASIAFLSKLLQARSQPTFLSNHPATRDRIVALQRQLATN